MFFSELISIVDSVQCCLENVCSSLETAFPPTAQASNIFEEPGKFSYLLKQIATEISVGKMQFLESKFKIIAFLPALLNLDYS